MTTTDAEELVRTLIAIGGILVVLLFLGIGFLTMRAGR